MITLNDIQALKPCWTKAKLVARVPAGGVSYTDIANAKDVSTTDRRWLLTQLAARTREGRNLLILWSAENAQMVQKNIPDGPLLDASLAAIAAAVACAESNTEETRSAAESAASAAWSAAWSAGSAAESAAESAASAASAAWSAGSAAESARSARSAAESAASAAWSAGSAAGSVRSAAWSAAWSAAEEEQITRLANVLEAM